MRLGTGTWLCPRDEDRVRLLENSERVRRARRIASLVSALITLCVAPLLNWWLVALLPLSALNLETVDARMRHSRRPERQAAASIFLSQCIVGAAIAMTGGPRSPMLAVIAVPTAFAATRFRPQVVWLAAATAALVLVAASFGVDASDSLAQPAALIVTVGVIIGVTVATRALTGAELHHRETAVLDPLTGLLNRQGLDRRFDELAEQAVLSGAPISLLLCDLDHFKSVNDRHGHARGDAVLRDFAYELRKQLRSFELIYRIGGEEFLVVLPGATPEDAMALGERLCETTRRGRPQGISLTLSVGISTRWGAAAQFRPLFDAADRALYRAKAEGRDRACRSSGEEASEPAAGAVAGVVTAC